MSVIEVVRILDYFHFTAIIFVHTSTRTHSQVDGPLYLIHSSHDWVIDRAIVHLLLSLINDFCKVSNTGFHEFFLFFVIAVSHKDKE